MSQVEEGVTIEGLLDRILSQVELLEVHLRIYQEKVNSALAPEQP